MSDCDWYAGSFMGVSTTQGDGRVTYRAPTPYVHVDRVIEDVRAAATEHGYAIAVHGSLRDGRDIDLIAVPWTPRAHAYSTLVKAIARIPYLNRPSGDKDTVKPHGRLAATFLIKHRKHGCPRYVDLSVTPRKGTGA